MWVPVGVITPLRQSMTGSGCDQLGMIKGGILTKVLIYFIANLCRNEQKTLGDECELPPPSVTVGGLSPRVRVQNPWMAKDLEVHRSAAGAPGCPRC